MLKAKWDLTEIKKFIEDDNIWFSCYSKSLDPVMKYHAKKGSNFSNDDAVEFILKHIQTLTVENFSNSILVFKVECDEYGIMIDNDPWYIKFSFRDSEGSECFNCISFHPPERDLKTNAGIISKGDKL